MSAPHYTFTYCPGCGHDPHVGRCEGVGGSGQCSCSTIPPLPLTAPADHSIRIRIEAVDRLTHALIEATDKFAQALNDYAAAMADTVKELHNREETTP